MSPALDFPDTIWTWIEQDSRSPECCEWFCETYRPAVLSYLRRRLPEQDAEDACQDFFATAVIGRGFLAQVDRTKGRLRSYLGSALDHFLVSRHRAVTAGKRGGGVRHVPLDGVDEADGVDGSVVLTDPGAGPDAAFDREWAVHLMKLAVEAARRDFIRKEREALFEALLPLVPEKGPRQADVAAVLGVSAPSLRVALKRLRGRISKRLEDEVRRTLRHPAMFDEEIAAVKQALGSWEPVEKPGPAADPESMVFV
jgi:DNA-directed RNA polymerase specialized sigma24 family protein